MLITTSGFAGEDRTKQWHTQFPWEGISLIQGGSGGIVFRDADKGGNYRTAFVEVFGEEVGFIRGEGATIPEAETKAWEKYQAAQKCPGHEPEARGYTNGAGFCKHCNRFMSKAFTAEQLGQFCRECHEPTYEQDYLGFACEEHIAGAEYRRQLDALQNSKAAGVMLSEEEDDQWWQLMRKAQAAAAGKDPEAII